VIVGCGYEPGGHTALLATPGKYMFGRGRGALTACAGIAPWP